jgi:transcription initiation factor TFIIIB Brf1 subunit/transcription initiation factor TFIIB
MAFRQLCCSNTDYPTHGTQDWFIGASVAIASAQFDNPLSIAHISESLATSSARIRDALNFLEDADEVQVSFRRRSNAVVRFVKLYCWSFELSSGFVDMAAELAANIYESGCLAYRVDVVACCAMVMVGDILENCASVPDLARVAGVDGRSIQSAYRCLLPVRGTVLNAEWADPWSEIGLGNGLGKERRVSLYEELSIMDFDDDGYIN